MHQPAVRPGDRGGDPPGGQGGRQGEHPAGERLAQAEDVRGGAGGGAGEQVPGAAEAGGDLVGDEQQAPLIADPAQPGDGGVVVEAHPAGALHHRLHDHRGDLRGDRGVDGGEVGVDLPRPGAAVRGPGREDLGGDGAAPQGVHAAVGIADAHRGAGVAVVAAAPGHQPGALRVPGGALVLQGHLHRDLHGHRSGVGEEDPVQVGFDQVEQPADQPHRRRVGEPAEHDVAHPAQLGVRGGGEPGVAVAVRHRPPGAHRVDELPAVGQPQPGALGGDHGQRGRRGGQRPVGVPDVRGVEGGEIGRGSWSGHGPQRN